MLLGLTLAALLAFACRQATPAEPVMMQARGVITDVSAVSLTQLKTLQVQTDDGELLDLEVEGDVSMTPSHAREHMALVEPVTVIYRQDADRRIALRVDD
ncbi:MAG: hypothetical protein U0821_04535 [Chloroflexota bacterium]